MTLVRPGVLYDDSPRWCSAKYEQVRTKRKTARVVVEVSECL